MKSKNLGRALGVCVAAVNLRLANASYSVTLITPSSDNVNIFGGDCYLSNSGEVSVEGQLNGSTGFGGFWTAQTGLSIFHQQSWGATVATAVNSSGEIVGDVATKSGTVYPTESTTAWTHVMATPDGLPAYATAINDNGQFVGCTAPNASSSDTGSTGERGVFWNRNQPVIMSTQYGSAPQNVIPTAINDSATVVGYVNVLPASGAAPARVAFEWNSGKTTFLPSPGGDADAVAINAKGAIVGDNTFASGHSYGAEWINGKIQEIAPLPGDVSSEADAINDAGVIVGASYSANSGLPSRAFIDTNGKVQTLASLFPASDDYLFTGAYGINDSGQILASLDTGTSSELVLLTPGGTTATPAELIASVTVPEPVSTALIAPLALTIGTRRARRFGPAAPTSRRRCS